MITRRAALKLAASTGVASSLLVGCGRQGGQTDAPVADDPQGNASTKTRLRILATSDTHGMFVPWDYMLDEEDPSGSMAKLAQAIKELRDDNTLLVDAGDTIQDNMADLFLADEVHPMIACMNELGYDIGVTGNHEYNFGMDVVRKAIESFSGKVITGNVIDEKGNPVADGYTIIDKGDVRVGLIGMVTPIIKRWDSTNLQGCTVNDPVVETRKIVDQIRDDVDVLVGVMHMGIENEYGVPHSGVRDLAQECPEFDLIVASHDHVLVEGDTINGVLVVENKFHAQTLAVVDLTLERGADGWTVTDRSSRSVEIAPYDLDPAIVELMASFDERAKTYAREEIGTLTGGPLAPHDEIDGIPAACLMDTAFMDLIHETQLYYSKADVSVSAYFVNGANVEPGPISRCDVSKIYKYTNTLYTLKMTGAQLRTFMEWSARFYQQYHEGDLTACFDPNIPLFNYDMFQGVTYRINVAKEPGSRIEELAWPNGTPVGDDDVFTLVTNNYRANTQLLEPNVLFEEGNMPTLLEADVQGGIGGVREMIADYIQNVKGGVVSSTCDNNWSIVGYDWDDEMHRRAVDMVADGTLTVELNEQGHYAIKPITMGDVAG
ncbi:MAG: 5'-nucleotidase C-terminal domain-containing protein [Atopobiaceae bacterium]|nr:5'-nucleotidase C-terminal domain-containing protein [Atopobiaceae bacterium]